MSVHNAVVKILLLSIYLCLFFSNLNSELPATKGSDTGDYSNTIDSQGNKQGKWIIYFDSLWNEVELDDNPYYYRLIEFKDNKPVGLVQNFWFS